jgi:hypothetical protein
VALGFPNVLFGTDYPHLEGTFPDTQKVLRELFDGVDAAVRDRITMGSFLECSPTSAVRRSPHEPVLQ